MAYFQGAKMLVSGSVQGSNFSKNPLPLGHPISRLLPQMTASLLRVWMPVPSSVTRRSFTRRCTFGHLAKQLGFPGKSSQCFKTAAFKNPTNLKENNKEVRCRKKFLLSLKGKECSFSAIHFQVQTAVSFRKGTVEAETATSRQFCHCEKIQKDDISGS